MENDQAIDRQPPGEVIDEPITETSLSPIFGAQSDQLEVHSFNMADPKESLLYVNAVGGKSTPLRDLKDQDITVSWYFAKPAQMVALPNDPRYAPGEIINFVRMVLVDEKGQQFHTSSPTAMKTIAALHKTSLGKKRFNPPIKLRIGEEKTRSGVFTTTLTLVPDDKEDKK